ncbi:MAG TPA: hypothetical protein VE338_05135 [Ktedonobacterales bacterium]|jgi:Flp pilus assembly protein TadB|nr:hypothetical protein [Ktedonobacterales bacterium]
MNPSQHVTTLRQTHRAATSLLPVLTATLTVAGVVIAAMEARTPHTSDEPRGEGEDLASSATNLQAASDAAALTFAGRANRANRAGAGRVTLGRFIATLIGRILLVALGAALVLALVYLATSTGRVGQAITLTALILLTFYLTEKVARR